MQQLVIGLFVWGAAGAFAFPQGSYVGKGQMKTAKGLNAEYVTKLTLKDNDMEAFYDYGNGKVVTYRATLKPKSQLEFEIVESEKVTGTGYCDNSICHLDVPGHQAEETWFFENTRLVRVGSMKHGEVNLIYTETLQLGGGAAREEKLVLECEGFEHSDTKKIRVYREGKSVGTVVEVTAQGKESKRALTANELTNEAYGISPIYGVDRVIQKKEGTWVLAYSCGEDRPLSCEEYR